MGSNPVQAWIFFVQGFFSQLLKLRSNCEDLSSIWSLIRSSNICFIYFNYIHLPDTGASSIVFFHLTTRKKKRFLRSSLLKPKVSILISTFNEALQWRWYVKCIKKVHLLKRIRISVETSSVHSKRFLWGFVHFALLDRAYIGSTIETDFSPLPLPPFFGSCLNFRAPNSEKRTNPTKTLATHARKRVGEEPPLMFSRETRWNKSRYNVNTVLSIPVM